MYRRVVALADDPRKLAVYMLQTVQGLHGVVDDRLISILALTLLLLCTVDTVGMDVPPIAP